MFWCVLNSWIPKVGKVVVPEHAAELLHVMQLEHLELLVEGALSHHNVDKLLLAVGTDCQHLLKLYYQTVENLSCRM